MSKVRIDIIPSQDEKFTVWGNHFVSALTPEIGVTDDAINTMRAGISAFSELVGKAAEVQNAAKQTFSLKKESRMQLVKALRGEIKRIKAREDYTEAVGHSLGIESQTKSLDMKDRAPQVNAVDRTGGLIELNFTKYGSDGVNVYCQRDGDTDWVFIGYAAQSPFEDKRPLLVTGHAELRRYSAVYVKKKQEVGVFSNEVTIACAP